MESQFDRYAPDSVDIDSLFHAYGDMVYRLALVRTKSRPDAEDIVQEVFIRCIKHPQQFASPDHAKAWFITVTINCTKSFLTSAFRRHTVPLDSVAEPESSDKMPDSSVYDAVMALPVKYRTAVHLFYYEDYSVKEISKMMNASESAVKSWLFRARAQLKEMLKGDFEDVS